MALTYTPNLDSSMTCPDFKLPGVDGKIYTRSDFENSQALLVLFICNHCPYVKAIEDRLIKLGEFMKSQKLSMVAICSNDADNYPEDSFEKLKQRWTEKKYTFPYLFDETQSVAKNFGAVCTPDFFLFNQNLKLTYRGRLDDSWKEPEKVTQEELKNAILALIKGESMSATQIPSMGCNIKWKKP
jgi:peroxiredoxin